MGVVIAISLNKSEGHKRKSKHQRERSISLSILLDICLVYETGNKHIFVAYYFMK